MFFNILFFTHKQLLRVCIDTKKICDVFGSISRIGSPVQNTTYRIYDMEVLSTPKM